jgi:gliding motility-associated-like protein
MKTNRLPLPDVVAVKKTSSKPIIQLLFTALLCLGIVLPVIAKTIPAKGLHQFAAPAITSFAPNHGPVGTLITVNPVPTLSYNIATSMLNKGQAVTITPTSSNVGAYGYDANTYPNSTSFMTGFSYPNAIATDAAGANVYIADRYQKRIVVMPAGYAGDIEGHASRIINTENTPFAITVDQQNNIYYSDTVGHDIIKCPPTSGCSVYATGFTFVFTMAINKAGDIYVIDSQEQKVKKVPAGGGTPVDFGGTWSAPNRLAVDAQGNVFVTDLVLKVTRKIPADGSAPVNFDAGITFPQAAQYGITADNSGNIFTSLFGPSSVEVREAFADGSGSVVIPFQPFTFDYSSNRPNLPKGIVVDALGRLQIADGLTTKRIETVKPIGGYFVQPALPQGLNLDRNTGVITGTPTTPQAATTYTITGWNTNGYTSTSITLGVQLAMPFIAYAVSSQTFNPGQAVNLTPTSSNVGAYGYNAKDYPNTTTYMTGFAYPNSVAIDKDGLNLYVADRRKKQIVVVPANYAGDIEGHTTRVYNLDSNPFVLAVDQQNNVYYSADTLNHDIVKCPPTGGCAVYATGFTAPISMATDKAGNLYVVDSQQLKVKRIPAGGGTPVDFGGTWSAPDRVAVDAKDNVYVNDLVLKITRKIPADGSAPVNFDAGITFPQYAQYGMTADNSGNIFTSLFTPSATEVREAFADGSGSVVIPFVPGAGQPYDLGNSPKLPKGIVVDALGRVHLSDGIPTMRVQTVKPIGGYFVQPALPDGLTLNRNTGAITGTPAKTQAATTYTITGWNTNGYTSTSITLGVQTTAPTVSATKLLFANTTGISTTLSWTNGNGAKRAVFLAKTANGYATPLNNISYTANAAFSSGSQIDQTGWYCVYNGTGNTVDITGLLASTTYRATVVEYNGDAGSEGYSLTKLAPASVATLATGPITPTVPSLNLTFSNTTATATTVSWKKGDGTSRAVFISKTANGYAVPVDNTLYAANPAYGQGTQIGTTNWYCIYNGTGESSAVTGLDPGATYRVTVVEYNGTGVTSKYMVTKLAPASVVTLATGPVAPTTPSVLLTFTNTTSNSTTVNWTSGNGANRAVFIAHTGNGYAVPTDNTAYNANTNFGSGAQVGATGWYCIYNGNGSSVNVTGLAEGQTYRVTVIEYNGSGVTSTYSLTKLAPASVATTVTGPIAPTTPSLQLTFSGTTSTATTVSWTSGNGANRAVFIAHTGNGYAIPADNTIYTVDTNFGSGTEVGATGWYCIYNGTGNSANVSGLTAGQTYRITVVEYNGTGATIAYMITKLAPASVATLAPGNVGLVSSNNSRLALVTGNLLADNTIVASNILSPNGDGKNDTWVVKNIDQYPNNSVTVYDQNKGIIFNKKAYANDWTGTSPSGTLTQGTYYYLIDLGNGTTMKGFITVLRSN